MASKNNSRDSKPSPNHPEKHRQNEALSRPENSAEFLRRSASIRNRLVSDGFLASPCVPLDEGENKNLNWKISPEPFWIEEGDLAFFEKLGPRLLSFYKALNRLYLASFHGRQPSWVAAYLDQGKPDSVISFGRMNRFKQHIPGIIRPDLIPTNEGWIATELDAVPGGIGLTGVLSSQYSALGNSVIGGPEGMVRGFARMIRSAAGSEHPRLAIIVSEESKEYRPEMRWLGRQLNALGLETDVIKPEEIYFTEEELSVDSGGRRRPIDVVYRFFELFDLNNIPKSDLILYSAKKKKVVLTPPPKAFQEEKMAFALFHHPALRSFWTDALGEETDRFLQQVFPLTWILDSREVPPHAVIPGFLHRGRPISNWGEIRHASQKERQYIIKPSGFSELAWGSRGVIAGHDQSEKDWEAHLSRALEQYPNTPHVLQTFHKGKKISIWVEPAEGQAPVPMRGRARISPYYFVEGDKAVLGGILATVCSLDKKLIHGMEDAVMVPCALRNPALPKAEEK